MNQNTTIETIRMIANRLLNPDSNRIDVRSDLCNLANRLEAAPQQSKERPPVEQSEPRHQLFAGMIHGLYKEPTEGRWIKWQGTPFCPHCDHPYSVESRKRGVADCCCENCGANAKTIVLAPPAVIEPEPPKCRTCEGVGLILGFGACPEGCAKSRELYREKWEVIDAVREIRSRKGDK